MYRMMTPILKLFTAKEAVAFCSEGLESFGAMGYMENSHLPVILRDAQVFPIWEGTTNVLSLDMLRAFTRDKEIIATLSERISTVTKKLEVFFGDDEAHKSLLFHFTTTFETWKSFWQPNGSFEYKTLEPNARRLAWSLGLILINLLESEYIVYVYLNAG